MNEITLSQRVQRVKPSPTLAVTARAAELRAAGKDIIGLGAGEPDFDTPEHIKQAAIVAIQNGATRYTAVDGTAELKSAIINKFQRDNGLSYQPDQILVSCGGKQSFYNLAQALLNPGDEVIIPAPYWVSYPDMVQACRWRTGDHQGGPGTAFQNQPGATGSGNYAEYTLVRYQQSIQPYRCGLHPRRADSAGRGAAAPPTRADCDRRYVRAYPLDR